MIRSKPFAATVCLFLLQCFCALFLSAAQKPVEQAVVLYLSICLKDCVDLQDVWQTLYISHYFWQIGTRELIKLSLEWETENCLPCDARRNLQEDPEDVGISGLASIKFEFSFDDNPNPPSLDEIEKALEEATDEITDEINQALAVYRSSKKSKSNKKKKAKKSKLGKNDKKKGKKNKGDGVWYPPTDDGSDWSF